MSPSSSLLIDTASVRAPCLVEAGDVQDPAASTELGVFFQREYWDVSDDDYSTLKQSMLLASNLLRAGLPFLMNYAPTYRAYDLLRDKEAAIHASAAAYQIDQAGYGSFSEDETLTELRDIAQVIKWQLNHTIAEHQRWVGVTRLVTDDEYGPRPWVDLLVKDVEASDQELKSQGFARRFLIIGIMKEYVDALKKFPQDSQEYLRATFLAAVTMTHEIAHAVWHVRLVPTPGIAPCRAELTSTQQDYRSMENDYAGFEPYYDNHCVSELGLSFVAYIFGGYCPFTTDRGVPTDFSSALCWEKVATTDKADVDLLFRTDYSISTSYIELVLSQELWNAVSLAATLDGGTGIEFSAKARCALKARTAAGPGEAEIARACIPEWTVSKYDGEVIWRNLFSDRRLALRDHKLLKNITEEDKKLEIHTLKMETLDSDEYGYDYGGAADVEDSDVEDLPKRPLYDGVLALDLPARGDSPIATRIEVRYIPGLAVANISKRRRPDDHDVGARSQPDRKRIQLDFDYDGKPQPAPHDDLFGFRDYEPDNIIALLADKHPRNIARMSLARAFQYCKTYGIRIEHSTPGRNLFEEHRPLDRCIPEDRALVERIRQYCLRQAEQLCEGDNQALMYIMAEAQSRLGDWSMEDLKETCRVQFLNQSGTKKDLQARVANWMQMLLKSHCEKFGLSGDLEALEAAGLTLTGVDVSEMRHETYVKYWKDNSLPSWGSRRTWVARYERSIEEKQLGNADRDDINRDHQGQRGHRAIDGIEIYSWDVDVTRTTVSTLKNALFEKGIFPASSSLSLYLGAGRQTPLVEERLRDAYTWTDWTDLWLEVSVPQRQVVESPVEILPPVYRSRFSDLIISPFSQPTAGAIPGVPRGPTGGDALIKTPPNTAIPAYIQRAYDIAHKKELPTVGEVLNAITASAAEIVKTMRPGGGHDSLRPHLSSARTNSAVEMLDNLLDLEEVQRDRQRQIDLLVDPDRVVEELRRERQAAAELAGYRFDGEGKVISRVGMASLAKPKRSPMQDLYLGLTANAKAKVQL
ncbi:hypothetical protein QTJ16_000615 [Diplocarpon rosae]|uniref:Uncharacterized protein n=1 Tax=Diplocarpon rosae TaxID=946125 RepID=A0AAD9T7G6_9HELO|nr:hypothetical protein QTJ16_000615 [Diplocarpon rosae]